MGHCCYLILLFDKYRLQQQGDISRYPHSIIPMLSVSGRDRIFFFRRLIFGFAHMDLLLILFLRRE